MTLVISVRIDHINYICTEISVKPFVKNVFSTQTADPVFSKLDGICRFS